MPRRDFADIVRATTAAASQYATGKAILGTRRFARAVARLGLTPEQVYASLQEMVPEEFEAARVEQALAGELPWAELSESEYQAALAELERQRASAGPGREATADAA